MICHTIMNGLRGIDWSLLQSFLAVAEEGSLTGAALATGQSQPTVGRHIRALEEQLGAVLFERHARGLKSTDVGAALIDPARRMRDAAAEVGLVAAGQDKALSGTVRITAARLVAAFVLPQIIAEIRRAEPRIQIEIVPSDGTENLLYREADIALRMYRPEQLDIVTQKLGEIETGLFIARSRVADIAGKSQGEILKAVPLVGYDRDTRLVEGFAERGIPLGREDFATRVDDPATYWQLVRAGCGIGFMMRIVGDRFDDVALVETAVELPRLPLWLAAPLAVRRVPRIDRVWTLLRNGLAGALTPAP